ncbi:MAG TPA: nickel-responsive transcriptional regulator NikR [Bacteroides sp.]|nr:nickel-responsive transcriptional regulator NikR [Bacteroides sp.]
MSVKRFGVSLEEELLDRLDRLVKDNQFPNRSQAIRFLIKQNEVEDLWKGDMEVAGALVLMYNHHKRDIQKQMTSIQHDYHCLILSSQHIHLDHDMCLETITVKGKAGKLLKLTDKLKAIKGIQHGELVMSSTH